MGRRPATIFMVLFRKAHLCQLSTFFREKIHQRFNENEMQWILRWVANQTKNILFIYLLSDWLYDCEIVHTPTTTTPFSQGQDHDFEVEESCASEQNLPHEILEVALRETGFRHRVWTTSSFATMQQHSPTNFLAGLEKIIQHVVKIFAPVDFKNVYSSLNERWNKKLKQRIEKKYGLVVRKDILFIASQVEWYDP